VKNKRHKLIIRHQREEETLSAVYGIIAKKTKNSRDKETLSKISNQKKENAAVWRRSSGKNIKLSRFKIIWYIILSYVMGYTFVIKFLNKNKYVNIDKYKIFEQDIPEISVIIENDKAHDFALAEMLYEERLKYTGEVVLGLNNALVEFMGMLAGLTFALANTKVIAATGIIAGTAATLSMAASDYLAERAKKNPQALKACIYSGTAYLVTVILLVLPYMLFPKNMYIAAFGVMMITSILIIFFFTYYISVAKSLSFIKQFVEMACISIGVSIVAFIVGITAKSYLGI